MESSGGGASAGGWRRCQTVPAHDLRELGQVRRASGSCRQHLVNLTEVVRRHDAGAGYRQELGVFGPVVVESMDCSTRYAERFAGANVERTALDRPSRGPLEPIDRLLERVVTVRRRHPAVGGNEALEDARASVRISRLDQEAHAEGTHLNHFRRCRSHRASSLMAPVSGAISIRRFAWKAALCRELLGGRWPGSAFSLTASGMKGLHRRHLRSPQMLVHDRAYLV